MTILSDVFPAPHITAVMIPNHISEARFDTLLDFISPGKQKFIRSLRFMEDKLRSLTGELLARRLIMEYTGLHHSHIHFYANEAGKPFLKTDGLLNNTIHFNISHAGQWVMVALYHSPVGVDVEKLDPLGWDVPPVMFSRQEQQYVSVNPNPLHAIFEIWTLKESYLKYTGYGFQQPLSHLSLQIASKGDIVMFRDQLPLKDIFFRRYELHPEYCCALCSGTRNFSPAIDVRPVEWLLETFPPSGASK